MRRRSRRDLATALLLGAALGGMSLAVFAAIARLPLGLVVTIAFLGPLSLSVFLSRGGVSLLLALLAGAGVALMLLPSALAGGAGWRIDPPGLGLAVTGAAAWAAYILLTRRVGRLFTGLDGWALSLLGAAVMLAPAGLPGLLSLPDPWLLLGSAGLAILAPLLPCALKMAALRRLDVQSFGILMSLEPAIAVLPGLAILGEVPAALQLLGVALVSLASAATVWLRPA